ncbi:MAG: hypothetical protein P1U39_08475 [Legionellaceae bacterium]|nr:hypothetical protein [Legionellaceae bacterium]
MNTQHDVNFTVGQALITSRDFMNVVLESLTTEQKIIFADHVLTRGHSCEFASAEDERYCVAHLKAILKIKPDWIMSLQPWPLEPELSTTMTFVELQHEYEIKKERDLWVDGWIKYVLELPFMPIPQMVGLALGLVILLNCSAVSMVALGAGLTFFSAAGLVMHACDHENYSRDGMLFS